MKATSIKRAGIETVGTGVVAQGIVMVSGILVARLLGVENRGHLALMVLFPLILSMTGTLGLQTAATYYVANGHDPRALLRTVRTSAMRQLLVLLVLEALILVAVFHDESNGVRTAAAFTALGLPAMLMLNWAQAILQGQERFRALNVSRLVGPVLYSAVLVLLFTTDADDIALVAGGWSVTVFVSSGALLAHALRHLRPGGAPPPPLDEIRRFGLKGLVGWASPLETFQLDQLFVGLALSAADLGLYVVGAAFTNLTRLFIPQSLGVIAYPHVAAKETRAEARRAVWRFFAVALAVCGVAVAILEGVVGPLIPVLFGYEFEDAVPLARILLIGSLFLALRRVLTDGTRGAGEPSLGTIAEVLTAAVAIPAVILVGTRSGPEGVAWALTAAYGVGLVLMIVMSAVRLSAPPTLSSEPDPRRGAIRPEPAEAEIV